MPRLTKQEQFAIWIVLLLLLGGAFGRAWLRHRPSATPAVAGAEMRRND
jgi:hypothetical protein